MKRHWAVRAMASRLSEGAVLGVVASVRPDSHAEITTLILADLEIGEANDLASLMTRGRIPHRISAVVGLWCA